VNKKLEKHALIALHLGSEVVRVACPKKKLVISMYHIGEIKM